MRQKLICFKLIFEDKICTLEKILRFTTFFRNLLFDMRYKFLKFF